MVEITLERDSFKEEGVFDGILQDVLNLSESDIYKIDVIRLFFNKESDECAITSLDRNDSEPDFDEDDLMRAHRQNDIVDLQANVRKRVIEDPDDEDYPVQMHGDDY